MMIGERTVKRQLYGSIVRKRLADVTNSPARHGFGREARSLQVSAPADDYANRLLQENMALSRVLEERNKVIELNVAELQKLRAMNQKMQIQNWSLAQSNSQILAELKFGREKMKTLQHELLCKEVLLKAKDMEIRQKTQGNPPEVATDPDDADKSYNHTRKRAMKSQSMVAINSRNQHVEKEMVKPKRQCVRRHSAKFGIQEQEAIVCTQRGSERSSFGIQEQESIVCTQRGSERSSLGRPSRRAAEKVRSYREASLNTKMRRSS